MAADPNPALRAELMAALDVLAPQLRGLADLAAVSHDALLDSINEQIASRTSRRDLIQSCIDHLDSTRDALTALEADGYPELPHSSIATAQWAALQEEVADVAAAKAVFVEMASKGTVVLGTPAAKPEVAHKKE
jgi:hypothetical protein